MSDSKLLSDSTIFKGVIESLTDSIASSADSLQDAVDDAVRVGLFTDLKNRNIPSTVKQVYTSGYSLHGTGSARYRVGLPTDAPALETTYSTNSKNGLPLYLVEKIPSVTMFGAIPDFDPGTGSGTDSYPAIQAALNWAAAQGGAEIIIPPIGTYKISQPLKPTGGVTLRGSSGIEGSPGMIYAMGSSFLDTGTSGYPIFNLIGVGAVGGNRGVTDFSVRSGGTWAYSNVIGCYFTNFNRFDQVLLGIHFINNNFQNFVKFRIGGADMTWFMNYGQFDTTNTTMTATDIFFQFQATSATDFSHNYFTGRLTATNDPILLDWSICDHCHCLFNKLDGGTTTTLRVSAGTNALIVEGNRINSASTYSGQSRVPILVTTEIWDVLIENNWIASLESGAPFITFAGGMYNVIVKNNSTKVNKTDTSLHTLSNTSFTTGSRITLEGPTLPKKISIPHGNRLFSPHFNCTLTNDTDGGQDNPRIIYVDLSVIKAGQVINCYRQDSTRKWVIYDEVQGVVVYDSTDARATRPFFHLVAPVDGNLVCTY